VLLNPGDPAAALGAPGLSVVAYWITAAVLILAAAGAGLVGVAVLPRARPTGQERPVPHPRDRHPHRGRQGRLRDGAAAPGRAPATLAPQADTGGCRLPDRPVARQERVGIVEDSILLIGPPRSGKGAHIVINTILDAPGAVVTTSTRPDNLTATLRARSASARSPCSTHSTSPKASPQASDGHPSAGARTR
jgi:type IV secretion system protein VirD4